MPRLPTIGLHCLFCLLPQTLLGGELDGRYLATLDGLPAEMILRSEGDQVEGEYVENASLRLTINGRFDGQLLQAQISDPRSGLLIANMNANYANAMLNVHIAARSPHNGAVLQREALFQRQAEDRASAPQPTNPERDPALIGTWVHEEIINSGGASFAAMTTLLTLQLAADGSVVQWIGAVAGGNDWNFTNPGELQYSGHWQSQNGLLLVQLQGRPDYQPAAHYRFSEQYLITESNTGKMIWHKR